MYKHHFMQLFRLGTVVIAGFAIYWFIRMTIPYIYPFLAALFFAVLLLPIVDFLEKKWKFPRIFAVCLTFFHLISLAIGGFIFIIVEIYHGTVYLADKIPGYFQNLITLMEEIFQSRIIPGYEKGLKLFLTLDSDQQTAIRNQLSRITESISQTGADMLESFLSYLPELVSFIPNSFTITIFIFLATFIILLDWHRLQANIKPFVPDRFLQSVHVSWSHLKTAVLHYAKAQLILVIITGVLTYFGLVIIGVRHALTISLFAMAIDLIPLIGTGFIFIPWILYLFFSGNYGFTIALIILYMILIIVRQVLEPKIISANLGMHPLLALAGYFIGIQLWGVMGVLLTPVLLLLLLVFYQAGVLRWVWNYIKG